MPQARDRRVSPLDIAATYARRRASILGLSDLEPLPTGSAPGAASPGSGRFGAQRSAIGRGSARFLHAPGSENSPTLTARRLRGGRRSSRSPLPSWYPRTPLRDITAVLRAIERRRSRFGDEEAQQFGASSFPSDQLLLPDSSSGSVSFSSKSVGVKLRTPAGSKVPKIVLDIANLPEEEGGESELLTPEKKLLNSIDKVEKVVTQELLKLKRTPSAKRAEREKRVRTLMSMR